MFCLEDLDVLVRDGGIWLQLDVLDLRAEPLQGVGEVIEIAAVLPQEHGHLSRVLYNALSVVSRDRLSDIADNDTKPPCGAGAASGGRCAHDRPLSDARPARPP